MLLLLSGKTTFLRALACGEIKGLPPSFQVLHVEQEVAGDDTTVLQVRMLHRLARDETHRALQTTAYNITCVGLHAVRCCASGMTHPGKVCRPAANVL